MTLADRNGQALGVPMIGEKGRQIRLGNPDEPVDAVCDEKPVGDPAPHAARRGADAVGDLLDRVEFRDRGSLARAGARCGQIRSRKGHTHLLPSNLRGDGRWRRALHMPQKWQRRLSNFRGKPDPYLSLSCELV